MLKKNLCRSCKIPFISCATSWCLSNLDSVVAIERKIEQSATPTTSEALQKRGMDRAAEGIHGPAAKRAHGHSGNDGRTVALVDVPDRRSWTQSTTEEFAVMQKKNFNAFSHARNLKLQEIQHN